MTNKLMIAVPSARQHANFFSSSMAGLIQHLNVRQIPYIINHMFGSSLLPAARQKAIEAAIESDCSHLLMLDDDMVFDNAAFDHLITSSHLGGLIAANYTSKGYGARPLTPLAQDKDGKPVSSIGKSGTERIREVGLGFALLDVSVMKNIPKPWFEVPYVDGQFLGEDYYFCRLLEHHDIPVYIDHDATRHVGHIGDMVFSEVYAEQQRAMGALVRHAAKLIDLETFWKEVLKDTDTKASGPPDLRDPVLKASACYDSMRDTIDELKAIEKWLKDDG